MAKTKRGSSAAANDSPQTNSKQLAIAGNKKKSRTGIKPKTTTSKKIVSKIDSLRPKKPPTAFFYFMEDFRKEYQEQNPDVKTMRDVGKASGVKWKTMTYEEKVKYYDIATEKRAEFETATAEFIRKKENGEFDNLEDDSELDE